MPVGDRAQFFLRIYELCLQASFRGEFTMEQLMAEVGPVMDQLWPDYERAALKAGLHKEAPVSELVLGGWSPKNGRMMAAAYAKQADCAPAVVQPLEGGVASPGAPLRGHPESFELDQILAAGKMQACYLNGVAGREVAGGRLLVALLQKGEALVKDLGDL